MYGINNVVEIVFIGEFAIFFDRFFRVANSIPNNISILSEYFALRRVISSLYSSGLTSGAPEMPSKKQS